MNFEKSYAKQVCRKRWIEVGSLAKTTTRETTTRETTTRETTTRETILRFGARLACQLQAGSAWPSYGCPE